MATGYDLFISAAREIARMTGLTFPVRFVEHHREAFAACDLRDKAYRRELTDQLLDFCRSRLAGNGIHVASDIFLRANLWLLHPREFQVVSGAGNVHLMGQEGKQLAFFLLQVTCIGPKGRRLVRKPVCPCGKRNDLRDAFFYFCLEHLEVKAVTETPAWSDSPEPRILTNFRMVAQEGLPLMEKVLSSDTRNAVVALLSVLPKHLLAPEEVRGITWRILRERRSLP